MSIVTGIAGFVVGFVVVFSIISVASNANRAYEAAILAHLRINHERVPGAWMKTTDLLSVVGGNVYPHLRKLVAAGLVEVMQRREPQDGPRGGRDSFWYRWNGVGKRDVVVENLRTF